MSSNTPVPSMRFFSGYWLTTARIVWVILCIISIGFLIIALTSTYMSWTGHGESCRVPMPNYAMLAGAVNDCETQIQAFQELSIPSWFPSALFTTGAGLQVASWILVGILIFWRKSHKPYEYLFSLMLVVSGTFNFDDSLATTGRFAIPALNSFFRIIGTFGNILLIVIYLFPD